jgi:uncharacterized protein (TIGR04255 family)
VIQDLQNAPELPNEVARFVTQQPLSFLTMSDSKFQLGQAPIIEAVLDIDCALPPSLKLEEMETPARDVFRANYPKFRKQLLLQHSIKQAAEGPAEVSGSKALQAFQFLTDDEKQLIQIRNSGFSFNRLEPYSSLDDYIPEIQKQWEAYRSLVAPVRVRRIALRFINRLLLPVDGGNLKLSDHLRQAPQIPEETRLSLTGFLHQHQAMEEGTGNQVAIILASQPVEDDSLPVILDITASRDCRLDPQDWEEISTVISSLRVLKNQVFRQSLTEPCLSRY